jgi:hypothetical protein
MRLHLCDDFDGVLHAEPGVGDVYAGQSRLLAILEALLGRSGFPEKTDYLRIALYKQALQEWLDTSDDPVFYRASFEVDRFAVARALLDRRDALLLAGWDLSWSDGLPERLRCLAGVEQLYARMTREPDLGAQAAGVADRWAAVLNHPEWCTLLPFTTLLVYEPQAHLATPLRRFVNGCRQAGISVEWVVPDPEAPADTDLGYWQRRLSGPAAEPVGPRGDGTLVVVHADRDSDAAAVLGQFVASQSTWRPLLLLPDMNRLLEESLTRYGQPALGIAAASLSRPALQVLKLASTFLWEPIDVYKLMEFVTLPVKPLDDGLALTIARVLQDRPGLFSETWYGAVLGYMDQHNDDARIRKQYDFWLKRRRYAPQTGVPRKEAVDLYNHLYLWAIERFGRKEETTLLGLAEQARRVRDLLSALPDERLTFLELERIVRTIYEPAPLPVSEPEAGRFDVVHAPGALAMPTPVLLWWNMHHYVAMAGSDFWRKEERAALERLGIALEQPGRTGRRQLHMDMLAVMRTRRQLVLMCPTHIDGAPVQPHLLMGDLEAAFINPENLYLSVKSPALGPVLLPGSEPLEDQPIHPRLAPELQTHLNLPVETVLEKPPYISVTNLEYLLYYPHCWFMRHYLRMYPASLLRISTDERLLGNLAHRFLELLLQEDRSGMNRDDVFQWIVSRADTLLQQEGAPLLLYGKEPERKAFINKVQRAAWALLNALHQNEWQVAHTEHAMEGALEGIPLRAKADLVLRRGSEWAVVDFKWSGSAFRKRLISNQEDLQLILYAHLLRADGPWPHTAYFIIDEGCIIARNRSAFAEAIEAGGKTDHEAVAVLLLDRIRRTMRWRLDQLHGGTLELRTARTAPELAHLYGDVLDLLEMRTNDARFDDYRFLLPG